MRVYQWSFTGAAAVLSIGGVWALLGMQGLAMPQAPASRSTHKPILVALRKAPLRPAHAEPAAGPAAKIETTIYNSWAVTCRSGAGVNKKSCLASLRVMSHNRRQVLLNWQIGYNPQGRLVTAISTPSGLAIKQDGKLVGGAISIAQGVELKLDNYPTRLLKFVSCGPKRCLAEIPMDAAFEKEALASSTAAIAVHVAGGSVPFKVSVAGIDKALDSMRK